MSGSGLAFGSMNDIKGAVVEAKTKEEVILAASTGSGALIALKLRSGPWSVAHDSTMVIQKPYIPGFNHCKLSFTVVIFQFNLFDKPPRLIALK